MPPLRPDQVAVPGALQGTGRDQHDAVGGQLHAAGGAHRRASEGRGLLPTRTSRSFPCPIIPRKAGWWPSCREARKTAKPMLLLGHLDVVEAKREDWTRDPFTLIEENGYFYGRGAADMKAMDATWIDALMRFKKSGYHAQAHHQAGADLRRGDHLRLQRRRSGWRRTGRELIAAAFALNEGGGGRTDGHGKLVVRVHSGGRKGRAKLPAGDGQCRRPQLHPDPRQRDLRTCRCACQGARSRISR